MKTLYEKRSALMAEAHGLIDTAAQADRALAENEAERYDQILAEIEKIDQDLERAARLDLLQRNADHSTGRQIPAEIGMNQAEIARYSITRAIRALADQNWRGAELERDASQAVADALGKAPNGFYVPWDVQMNRRDLTVGQPSAGGYLVPTDQLSMIELLRNRMVLAQAGAMILSGLSGDIAIPKQTGGATAYWVGETQALTESAQTFGQVAMKPHTVGAYVDYSRSLMKQSSVNVDQLVAGDLALVLALAADVAGLHGAGSANQPLGIANTTGIGSVAIGTDGGAPTWAAMIGLETEVATDNADVGRLAYITNAKVRGKLKATPRTATYGDIMIWEPTAGNTPVNGYPVLISNQVSSTLTKGNSGAVCSAMFFGNWGDLMIGQWGGLDIVVNPYTLSTQGLIRVVAMQDLDIAVRRPESFAAVLDLTTT